MKRTSLLVVACLLCIGCGGMETGSAPCPGGDAGEEKAPACPMAGDPLDVHSALRSRYTGEAGPAGRRAGDGEDGDGWSGGDVTTEGGVEAPEPVPGPSAGEPDAFAPPSACVSACDGERGRKECGGDGCGGSCGACPAGVACLEGQCLVGPPPAPGEVIVSELMVNPAAVPDTAGEWFELWNLTPKTLDLWNLRVRDGGKDQFTVGDSLPVGPWGQVVLARKGYHGENGGVIPHYVYSNFKLSNVQDSVVLEHGAKEIDRVEYKVPEWKLPAGASLALDPLLADSELNDLPDAWCPSTAQMAGGDKGSPGSPNGACE